MRSIFPVSSLLHRCAHRLYTGPTRLIWSFAGVASLPWPQTATQGQTGPSLRFLPKNEFTPPPIGGGAGFGQLQVCWAGLFRPQTVHMAFTGRIWVLLALFPYPRPRPATNRRTGPSLVFVHSLTLLQGKSYRASLAISCTISGRRRMHFTSPLKRHPVKHVTRASDFQTC